MYQLGKHSNSILTSYGLQSYWQFADISTEFLGASVWLVMNCKKKSLVISQFIWNDIDTVRLTHCDWTWVFSGLEIVSRLCLSCLFSDISLIRILTVIGWHCVMDSLLICSFVCLHSLNAVVHCILQICWWCGCQDICHCRQPHVDALS
jgi:hypothetical protein